MKKSYAILLAVCLVIFALVAVIYIFFDNDKSKIHNQANGLQQNSSEQIKGVSTQSDEQIIRTVDGKEAQEIVKNNSELIIIDLRTPEEYAEGYIENAVNINFYDEYFKESIKSLDKTRPYLIYCHSGKRSSQALNIFVEQGIKEVYELKGGYLEWIEV